MKNKKGTWVYTRKVKACEILTRDDIKFIKDKTHKYDCCGLRVKLTTPKDAVDPHMQKRINIYRECGSWELAETSINFEILRKALRGVS